MLRAHYAENKRNSRHKIYNVEQELGRCDVTERGNAVVRAVRRARTRISLRSGHLSLLQDAVLRMAFETQVLAVALFVLLMQRCNQNQVTNLN